MREALGANVSQRGELGAAVAVIVEGTLVVDLWCGWRDAACQCPWRQDTLVNVFSVGKAFAGLCVLMLVSRGLVALDEPLARHWPEFAGADKGAVTVRQVLAHRAGLAAIERDLPEGALYDWDRIVGALAEQAPWWTPGEAHGYHVHTFGFLAGELVRRVTGDSIGAFLQHELAGPLGAQLSFGLTPDLRARRAEYAFDVELPARVRREGRSHANPHLYERAYANPPGATGMGTVNTSAWQDAELPSANLHADARSIARLYDALLSARGGRATAPVGRAPLLSEEVLAQATAEASSGADLVLGRPSRFGLGFQLTQPERPLGPNKGGFGHFGAGGSLGFADPDADVAFAYVMNRGGPQWQDPRNRALVDAVYAALGG